MPLLERSLTLKHCKWKSIPPNGVKEKAISLKRKFEVVRTDRLADLHNLVVNSKRLVIDTDRPQVVSFKS